MKKIFAGLMIIGLIGMVAGTGTFATFSDMEKSQGNSVQAGVIDLGMSVDDHKTEDGDWETDSKEFSFDLDQLKPGESKTVTVVVANEGNIVAGAQHFKFDIEPKQGKYGDFDTDNNSNLANAIIVEEIRYAVHLDKEEAPYIVTDKVNSHYGDGDSTFHLSDIDEKWCTSACGMDPGVSRYIEFKFKLPEDAGNDYQGDKVVIDFQYKLTQEGSGSGW